MVDLKILCRSSAPGRADGVDYSHQFTALSNFQKKTGRKDRSAGGTMNIESTHRSIISAAADKATPAENVTYHVGSLLTVRAESELH